MRGSTTGAARRPTSEIRGLSQIYLRAVPGTDVKALKEKDGSPLGEKVFNAAKDGTVSTVSYNFPKPGTTDPVAKESYVTRVGNQGCGVGYYK